MSRITFNEKAGKSLLLMLFLFVLSFQVKAQPPSGGLGTEISPYIIATLDDLKWIADQVNGGVSEFLTTENGNNLMFSGKYFKQTANIDAAETSGWNSGAGWTAIGAEMSNAFSGSYDGQGYTISNLYVNNSTHYGDGLFAYCLGATIKNLGLTNVNINSGDLVGGLVGYIDKNDAGNSSISNCYVTGSVTAQNDVGGLIGEADNTTIDNCYAECTLTCTGNSPIVSNPAGSAGGFMSNSIDCTISNSYASGSITVSNSASAGGFSGSAYGTTINSCYSSCTVSTSGIAYNGSQYFSNIGGFLGDSKNSNISNCYAIGSISANGVTDVSRIGGFVGTNGTSISYCYATSSIAITGTSDPTKIGGFIGVNFIDESTPIYGVVNTNCYWNSTIFSGNGCGTNPSGATFSATGKTTPAMQIQSTFTGWDFVGETANGTNDYWNRIDTKNNKYPYLEWQVLPFTAAVSTTAISTYGVTSATMGGNITVDGGATVTERGVVYSSTDATPTIGKTGVTKNANGTGIGTFSKSIAGLSANTTYNVCAYATNSAGTSYGTVTNFSTLVAVPTVTGISPSNGPTTGTTSVTITGADLTAASTVMFGGTNATGFTVNSATQITATAPAGSAGTVDITVTTAGGTSATSSADQFTYVAAPTITGISTTSGPTAGSTSVVITGTNFLAASAVKFGATNATGYTIHSATQITATSPAGSAGSVDITVTTIGGTSATSSADQFTYVAAPTITGISTTSGPTAGSTSVVISGTNFLSASVVKFGSTNATGYTVNSATQITATSPAGSAGVVDITVTTTGGTSATSASDQFTYVAAPAATTNAATSITSAGATLAGTINANNASTTVTFEYGLNTSYGTIVTADQSPVTGSTTTPVSKAITGLTVGVTYYYRVVGVNAGGTTNGLGKSFTTPLLIGNGTPADPYQIATLADLKWVSEHSDIWNSSFIQTADIDAALTSTWNISKGFSPIGNNTVDFKGNYNGQGHTITGLTISRSSEYNIGLFGMTNNASIKNIGLLNCSVTGFQNVGSLVGISSSASAISNCYCTGSVSGSNYVGGLVGGNQYSTIANCYSTVSVIGSTDVGGLVGGNIASEITITNSFYDKNTSGQSDTGKGTPKTTAELKTQSTFTGWDFAGETANGTTDIWAISSTQNNGYPCFMSQITSPTAPTVTTHAITGIATTTATGNGNITGLGVPNPGSHGVCWGINANPTITDNSVANIGGTSATGAFTAPITGLTPNTLYHVRAYATNSTGTVYGIDESFTTKIPTITSATYNASAGVLVLTCLDINSGDIISPAKMTLTGEGGTPYSLTTANVAASGSTSASITLNATDKAAINQIFNKNGTSSTGATTYNLAAADDWDTSISAGNISDLTGNGITVSNVAVPTITSATYNAATGALVVAGTGFLKLSGAVNDINVSKLTVTGEAGATYTLTTPNVEISSGTSFTVPLNATDKAGVNQLINKNGASSIAGIAYNLAAAEDWDAGADVAVDIADLTGNGIVVSNLASPTVTTQAVSDITAISATGNGNITSMGVPNPTQYGVVWSTSPNPTVDLTTKTTQGTAAATGVFASSITGLTPNTTYYVKAYATNIVGTSYGAEVSFISSDIVPDAPTAVLATGGNGQAIVSFTAPASNGGTSITGYTVTANPGGLTATGGSSPITIVGLTNGVSYTFTVTATNVKGTGTPSTASNNVSPSLAVQAITFNALPTKTYGDVVYSLAATSDAGLAISFASDNTAVASVSGNTVTIVGAGTANITASQAGNTTYAAAANVIQQLTVNKKAITVAAVADTKVYNGTTISTAAPTVGTLAAGDAIDVAPTQSFDNASVGTTHVLTASGLTIKNGSTDVTSNYEISYATATGTINKLAVTVTAATNTKIYDGTTVSTAVPTIGTLATGDAISTAPTQAFDNAAVGTTHVLTASGLTIKKGTTDVTGNYDISYTTATGSITAKPLTITTPTVTLSKVYDGKTVAIVSAGTLLGVVAGDGGKVTVTAAANYDNASVGPNKTITVVYTLGGSAVGNYSAPANFVATGAEISSGVITLEPLSNPIPNQANTGLVLSYNVVTGGPTQYQITYEARALAVGMQNVSYTALVTTGTSGSISINVPAGTRPGIYKGSLQMRNDSGVESTVYNFELTVNIPTEYIVVKYNRVLVLDNSTKIFIAYQWYKDGVAIEGATKQFYSDPKGLVGTYSMKATTGEGEVLYSYPKVLNIPLVQKVTAYPSLVRANQTCTVEITDEAMELDLKGAELSVYSSQGIRVYYSTKVEKLNTIKLPIMDGMYSGRLTTADGQTFIFKVIVAN